MKNSRDTIVIGTSSGGLAALSTLLCKLSPDLPAAIFIVQHQASNAGLLADVLSTKIKRQVIRVDNNQPIVSGQIYLAPPDAHLVISEKQVGVSHGPRENRSRPSINVLFRSAAASRSSRVIGILLTGMLDDGVAGLEAIQRCGGISIVQDPQEAEYSELPRNAIDTLAIDHVVSLQELTNLLAKITQEHTAKVEVPRDVIIEASFNDPDGSHVKELEKIGAHMALSCPDCGGPLWKTNDRKADIYRCHIGHAMSTQTLLGSQAEEIEQSLWIAVRALTERAATLHKLAKSMGSRSHSTAMQIEKNASEAANHAEQARQFLLSLRLPAKAG